MKPTAVLCMMAIVLGGCKTYYEFDTAGFQSTESAKKAIERLVRSQGDKFTPNSIELTDEFLGYSKEYKEGGGWGWYGYGRGTTTVNRSNAIYFDTIDEILFLKKKGHYEIRIHNKSSGKWKIFFCWDYEMSEKGAAGFAFMRDYVKAQM